MVVKPHWLDEFELVYNFYPVYAHICVHRFDVHMFVVKVFNNKIKLLLTTNNYYKQILFTQGRKNVSVKHTQYSSRRVSFYALTWNLFCCFNQFKMDICMLIEKKLYSYEDHIHTKRFKIILYIIRDKGDTPRKLQLLWEQYPTKYTHARNLLK